MRRNGRTSKGSPRWRCTTCGASITNTRPDDQHAHRFGLFITWILNSQSRTSLAHQLGISRRTLTNWFHDYWFIQVPRNTDTRRVHDQLFIDGTYFNTTCLLVVCTAEHVVAWHWCTREDSDSYTRLFDQIPAPLIVTTDGQQGALKAIRDTWPQATIQRCIVHVKRNIQTHVTLRPQLPAGKALRQLSLKLLRVTTPEQAATWLVLLQQFHGVYGPWLNEKTYKAHVPADQVPAFARTNKAWWFTHHRHRRAYKQLEKLATSGHLFTFLTPPEGVTTPVKATTNCLEGGVNAQIKALARHHRGMFDEHQRIAVDWWLYTHTQLPDDPISIARQQQWGKVGLAKVTDLINQQQPDVGREDGRPATYDTGIDATPTNSMGIRRGWLGR